MRIFLTGATGVFGHRLVDRLSDRGHDVFGLARDDEGAERVRSLGGSPVRGDVLDRESLRDAIGGVDLDVVVHAATKLPAKMETTAEYWARNGRVRREGVENLVAIAGEEIDRFVFPSVVWVARQPDGSAFDEDAERYPNRATQSAADVEDFLREAGPAHGFDPLVLRTGMFYGPDDGNTRLFAANLLSGDMPIVGGGALGRRDAELSLLHLDDAARAFAAAIDADVDGLYHVVDEEPVAVADYLRTFADLLDAPEPRRIPWWVARPLAGKDAVRFMTNSMPTSADRFRNAVDWEPAYPTYREGLRQVVEIWEREGRFRGQGQGGVVRSASESIT